MSAEIFIPEVFVIKAILYLVVRCLIVHYWYSITKTLSN